MNSGPCSPFPLGALQGKLDTKTREAHGTPPHHLLTCRPKEAAFLQVGWACPRSGSFCRWRHSPFLLAFHLPSTAHPAGPVVGILPDFFQPSPGEGWGHMQGTHWTRPPGAPGPHWTTLVPGEVAVPPASFLSHTGHCQLRNWGMRWTRKPNPYGGPQPWLPSDPRPRHTGPGVILS